MKEYDSTLESYDSGTTAQPTGVSGQNVRDDANADWNHRTEMAQEGDLQYDEQLTVSQAVNTRKAGEMVTLPNEKPDFLKEDPSEQGEEKSTAQRYRERYSHHWSDETKEAALELKKSRSDT